MKKALYPVSYTHLGASGQTLAYAYDFMLVTLLGLPVTYVFFNLNHVMRATAVSYTHLARRAPACLTACTFPPATPRCPPASAPPPSASAFLRKAC